MRKEERVNWAGRINNIRKDFTDFPEMSMRAAAMQLEIVDILIDQLQNHELFSTVLHREGTNAYRIALSKKYRNVKMDVIKVNFNRFNMSLMVTDQSGDLKYGTFRYRTIQNKSINCTLTSLLHFSTDDEETLINELKDVFYEAEQIYEASDKRYREFGDEDNVDLNKFKFIDLCTKYTGWQTHVGYARKCEALRYGYSDDTESLLTKEDRCYSTQCDVVMTADEVAACADLAEALMDKLHDSSWKWTNPEFVDSLINDLA